MKMTNDALNLLKKNRPLIILTEIIGFLHDLGKLDDKCHEDHNERIRSELGSKLNIKETSNGTISSNEIPEIIFDLVTTPLNYFSICSSEFLSFLCDGKKTPTILSPLFYHHHHYYKEDFNPRNNFEELIANADSQDSNEDRGVHEEESSYLCLDCKNVTKAERKLQNCEKCDSNNLVSLFYIATPFGFEELLDEKIKNELLKLGVKNRTACRLKFYQEFAEILKKIAYKENEKIKFGTDKVSWKIFKNKFYEIVKKYFPLSLAETRRPSNDINLFDHCYMTGTISKVGVVGLILSERFREGFKEAISTNGKYKSNFKLLMVGFDGESFLTKVDRLPDFIGRMEKLNEVRKKIREIVEFEIPVGNLVYENLSLMSFLIPDLASLEGGSEIVNELREKIISIVINETNGLIVPLVEVYGKREDDKSYEYIGPLIENAKEIATRIIHIPYHANSDLIRNLPWVKDWEKVWMWECDNCHHSGVNYEKFERCPKCNLKKLKQKPREKCYVCGYAPEHPIPEGVVSTKGEKLCKYCYNLRLMGIIKRLGKKETIWLDQMRDEKPSNRIALVIGKLSPVEKWLNGDYIKETTFTVFAHPTKGKTKREKLNQIKGILKTSGETRTELCEEVRRSVVHNPESLEYFNSEINRLIKESALDDKCAEYLIQKLNGLLFKKPASPSRLRRVWKELEEFSEKSIELSQEFFEKRRRKQLTLEVNKELKTRMLGKSKIGTIICKDKKTIVTVDYLDANKDNKKLDELSEEEIREWFIGKELEVEWEDGRKDEIQITNIIGTDYVPLVPIYKIAGEFMFLCPASHALKITSLIKDIFLKRFEKAFGRLALNIGIIYFKYKQPLYVVLDAGKRLIKEFEKLSLEEKNLKIRKGDGNYLIPELELSINPKLGDGTDDWYYSTVKIADTCEHVPLLEIQEEKKIKLFLNRFDYEYLESTQTRFNIRLSASMKREHRILGEFGPRPYLLENTKFIELWNKINPRNGKLTTSQIKKLEYICASKIEEWELKDKSTTDNDKFRKFVETSVKNICDKLNEGERRELVESILSGTFFDHIELFMTLKSEIGSEQNG